MALFRRKAVPEAAPRPDPRAALERPNMALGAQIEVVGTIAHTAQVVALLDGSELIDAVAVLTPEPFDHADARAVGVHVHGELVGHLPRDAAHHYFDAIGTTIGHAGLATVHARLCRVDGRPTVLIEPPVHGDGAERAPG